MITRPPAGDDRFAGARVLDLPAWQGTEWFTPSKDLLRHIDQLVQP